MDLQAPTLLNFGLPSASASTKNIARALCAAQKEIEPAIKDKVNPAFRSRYADLSAVYDACIPALTRAGIAVAGHLHLYPVESEGLVILEMRLTHAETGEFFSSFFPVVPQKKDPQGMGSALTYARRYCLSALVCVVADDDDDGHAASKRHKHTSEDRPMHAKIQTHVRPQTQAPHPQTTKAPATMGPKAAGMLKGIAVARDGAALQNFRNMVQDGGFAGDELASLQEACEARSQELARSNNGRAATERALDGF
jgi:hypothetical protein